MRLTSVGEPATSGQHVLPCPTLTERSSLQLCLKHTVNNLLQSKEFDVTDLNTIADQLPTYGLQWHRTLWLGNYDVNVLEAALATRGKTLAWHVGGAAAVDSLDLSSGGCFGLVLNVPSSNLFTALLSGRHWLALRRINGCWWNLDSNLPAPTCFASNRSDGDDGASGLRDFLKVQIANGAHLLRVLEAVEDQDS